MDRRLAYWLWAHYSYLLRVRLRTAVPRLARLPGWTSGAKIFRVREFYMQWPRAEPRLRIVSTPQGLAVVVARELLDDMIEGVLRREMLWA